MLIEYESKQMTLISGVLGWQKDVGLLRKVIFERIRRTLMGLIQVPSSLDY